MPFEVLHIPRYSVVPDKKEETPITPELFLEQQLDQHLKSAPERQRNLLRHGPEREEVLRKLNELTSLLPILERMSEVAEAEAGRLGVEEGVNFKDTVIRDRVALTCQMAVLEFHNQTLTIENKELRAKIKIDPLTDLANRRGYDEEAERALELTKRNKLTLWCFMIDVDDFRHVNNDYGHLAGDQVLKEIGRRLKTETRSSDFIARFGGEEFIALVFGDEEGARGAISRIVETIGKRPFVVRTNSGVKKLRITVSAGGSHFRLEEDDQKSKLEERADKSLYRAKNFGKNQAYLEEIKVDSAELHAGSGEEGDLAISSVGR